MLGITGDWSTAALDPLEFGITHCSKGVSCRFMLVWVKGDEKKSKIRQRKREAGEADKVEVAPGVTVASLRRFRAALSGPTQGLPKWRRLRR